MGYRRVPTIYELDFEGTDLDGLKVKMRSMRIGKIRKLLTSIQSDADDLSAEEMDEMLKMFVENVVSWNLEDEYGNEVPCTMDGVDDQEFSLVFEVMKAWFDVMTGPSDDLGKDSDSGETSRVPLPPMVAL